MSQEQPRRPQGTLDDQSIKYGDVFNVSGELASQKIAPRDAAAMQSAETRALGGVQKGGPAAVMESAAEFNESIGAVAHDEVSQTVGQQGVTIAQGIAVGRRVIAEADGGKVIGGYAEIGRPVEGAAGRARNQGQGQGQEQRNQDQGEGEGEGEEERSPSPALGCGQITIGEALEAAALVAGDKPVDTSDAAAVQVAEIRATGMGQVLLGGIGAEAQSAATLNPAAAEKTTLSEVIGAATNKLPVDKPVSREDADRVAAAETRNDPRGEPRFGGVASAVAAASRINEKAKTS